MKNVRIKILTILYFFLKNKEKHLEILFYNYVPKILMIIYLQFLRFRMWQIEIGNYGPLFALLPILPKNQRSQNFEKMKKFAGDTIILHIGTKNHNHMRYSS